MPTLGAVLRVSQALTAATARTRSALTAVMNHEVTHVRDPAERISKNEHGIPLLERCVGEEAETSGEAQPPEGDRHNHLLPAFRGIPLNSEAREEADIPQPANQLPGVPVSTQKSAGHRSE